MAKPINISIVVPVYKCTVCLDELCSRLDSTLNSLVEDYEIILVNDASPDEAWEVIQKLKQKFLNIRGVNLSRNFGQHYAILAGLEFSCGDWVVVMDGDLQDQPEEIAKLYAKAQEDYDLVLAQRLQRQDSFRKRMSSYVFYKVLSYLTDTTQDESIGNFGIYHRKVIDAVLEMQDRVKYFPVMVRWVGFKARELEIEHSHREEGQSSYTLMKLLSLAFNIMVSFSNKPLKLMVNCGVCVSVFSLCAALYFFYQWSQGMVMVEGWTSLILSIWFLSGVLMIMLGIIGIYIGKVFDQSKRRPLYIVDEEI